MRQCRTGSRGSPEVRVIYGINPVIEALASGEGIEKVVISSSRSDKPVNEILNTARSRGIKVEVSPPDELKRLSGTDKHQGAVAFLKGAFRYREMEDLIAAWKKSGEEAFFLILDSIQDPQNLGSLVRAADAAGVHGIIIPKDRATEVTPVVAKASAGATEHALIAREVNITRAIERLKVENVWVAGIEAGRGEEIYRADLNRDLAIVVGSEGKGIRRLVLEACDFLVSIPMAGKISSLNAAQAGAIALFEAKRQRMKK
ncbi:MAG: 23S rRNA (guanosine(2251)-2'-O)-methyltransferase RlmB [Deltaproteobacteria bacterium GWC2_56_8]|nr:MAG: 23S rRNA (guanosine(2251)-2'-O)-methyltransferase RlmB [Deltaproteobacteria bacterium GWB2_55_19]OGP36226.1 MAG: 23S rRNA (guanosine(2251)-2'-O)-methyltransferase RlmB [Deltaproteobacteria bacterium GWC2_56_8]